MSIFKNLCCLVIILGLASCGGGGGGGGGGCSDLNLKITGGTQCNFSKRSPVVAVVLGRDGGPGNYTILGSCTGTMVTVNDVLTAAHCFVDAAAAGANDVFVVADQSPGDANIELEDIFEVTNLAINPFYTGSPGQPGLFDTAMVSLDRIVDASPVPILVTDPIAVGEPISVFGYGDDGQGRDFLTTGLSSLKGGSMEISVVGTGVFAASFDSTDTAICQGDSGGPVVQVVDGVSSIVGVTSFTIFGCKDGSASGFQDMQINGNVNFVRDFAPDVTIR